MDTIKNEYMNQLIKQKNEYESQIKEINEKQEKKEKESDNEIFNLRKLLMNLV